MVEINSKIEGLEQLGKNIDKLSKSFARTTLRTALRNAAKPVRDLARDKVDVDSGPDLRRGIATEAKVNRDGEGYANVGFNRTTFYGGFVELGTSQQSARPFLRPALDEADSKGLIGDAFILAINATIAKQIKKLT